MNKASKHVVSREAVAGAMPSMPVVVDRAIFQAELDALRDREKATLAKATRSRPPVAACRWWRLNPASRSSVPTVRPPCSRRSRAVDSSSHTTSCGPQAGRAAEQCEGCTWFTTQVAELSHLHSRDITFAVLCKGPYEESIRYHDFMDWKMPWYSAEASLDALLPGRDLGMMYLACYVRGEGSVYETYWTTIRGVEAMDNTYRLMDLTVYGRQETWEDAPPDWLQNVNNSSLRTNGRPVAQWPRLEAGRPTSSSTQGRSHDGRARVRVYVNPTDSNTRGLVVIPTKSRRNHSKPNSMSATQNEDWSGGPGVAGSSPVSPTGAQREFAQRDCEVCWAPAAHGA